MQFSSNKSTNLERESMNNQAVDDQMAFLPPYYTGEVAVKPRQRRPRKKNKGVVGFQKRKLSEEQGTMLELHFACEHKLESERKDRLASELGLDPRQVAVWFQNRRARWKSQKLEEEYSTLKNEHATTIIQKCLLETEVLKLKEQLNEAEKQIKMVLERSSNSPTSLFSMEPPFLGEFGVEVFDNMFYLPENNYTFMDWNGF